MFQLVASMDPKTCPIDMPNIEAKRSVLSLRVLAHMQIELTRAHYLDFQFFKCVTTKSTTPEFSGFNTRLTREQGQSVKPATRAIYTPLIDMTPADPDTILTAAMTEAQRLTEECGQSVTIFTNDQQLYTLEVNVMWVYPERFHEFIPR